MFDFPASPTVGQTFAPAGGPVWTWDGTVWKAAQTQGEMQINKIFIPGGAALVNYTYTKPANLRQLEFEGSAAGGSGSGAAATAASTFAFGGGGSAGAWGKKLFQAAALPASIAISIGAYGAASTGAGIAAGNLTFGSLITLPGGPGGPQGSNTTGTSVLGSQPNASGAPTGVDIGAAGAPGYQSIANLSFATGNSQIGGGGPSPYGQAWPTWTTINTVGIAGSGYGAGGASAANGASQAARASAAGQPGFVMLTEYLAVAPADVTKPQRQTFQVGASGVVVPVPATAKMAFVKGKLYNAVAAATSTWLQFSLDGINWYGGASDQTLGGTNHLSGTGSSPVKQAYANSTAVTVAPPSDGTFVPIMLDFDLFVSKDGAAGAQTFGGMTRGWSYQGNTTDLFHSFQWAFHTGSNTPLNNVNQIPFFRIIPSANTFAAGSMIVVDWIY